MPSPAREAAVQALIRVDRDEGYSSRVLDKQLSDRPLSPADGALASRLFYGVLERRLTLDYAIGCCSRLPLSKMERAVLQILRVGAYQLLFLDKIPLSAAVNEAVELTKRMGAPRASGFVNGVLRGLSRRRDALFDVLPAGREEEIRFSCPRELIAGWRADYGEETVASLLRSLLQPPDQCLRVNTLLTDADTLQERLKTQGISCRRDAVFPVCLRLERTASLKKLAKWSENWYYHQDTGSQYACAALDAWPGERLVDVCAAPGGKSFTLAQQMGNQGTILAFDLYDWKCAEMARRAQALGITIIQTAARDACEPCPVELREAFDRVICDVPCSGLGVLRRKPEIRYKPLSSFDALPPLQLRILERAADLVRPGGVLQYSTCTLRKAENEEVAQAFLARHPGFEPRVLPIPAAFEAAGLPASWYITLFPHLHATDGFFIAGFRKKEV